MEYLRHILRDSRNICSTSVILEDRAVGPLPEILVEVSGQVNIMDAGCLCVGRQYLELLDIILRGRCSTWSTSRKVRGSLGTSKYYGPRIPLWGRDNIWKTLISFCVIGAAFAVPPERSATAFVWQVQYLEPLKLIFRGKRSICSTSISFCVAGITLGAFQAQFAWQVQHLQPLNLILHGRRSTWSISGSFCLVGAVFGASLARFGW